MKNLNILGRGGGHGGGGHGGHGGHHGGGRGVGWWWGGPYGYYYDDGCDYYAPDGTCLQVVPMPMQRVDGVLTPVNLPGEEARNRRVSERAMDMAKLKLVTVDIGQSLVTAGMHAIDSAIALATNAGLPLPTARQKAKDKLTAHQMALGRLADKQAPYPLGEQLKNDVLNAFTEYDAAEEGAAYMVKLWGDMWAEIYEKLKNLPAEIKKQVGDIAKNVAWYGKATFWVAIGGGALALGLIGWGVASGLKKRIGG